ncbi:hypothetical protein [Brevundimonas lutea]|uniref:hypothetical protein n=1 Tax=Brevundimonas lutea TaxID=2293980 RepID=UPI000F029D46|nr:hypothetical protein [Brevundimonas lutea]
MTRRAVALTTAMTLALMASGLATWHQVNRPGMIGALCQAGLPNLSRPPNVDVDALGCVVLGEREALTGLIITTFETADFLPDGEPIRGASFAQTEGLMSRGGRDLRAAVEMSKPLTCGIGLSRVRVEGWMTVTPGSYGHLGMAPREFYADRILTARAPSATELDPILPAVAEVMRNGGCDRLGRTWTLEPE